MVKVTRETRVTAAAAETVLMFGRAAATTTAPTAATKLYAHCPPREEECTDKGFRSKKGAKLNVYSGFFCHAGGMLCTRSTYWLYGTCQPETRCAFGPPLQFCRQICVTGTWYAALILL